MASGFGRANALRHVGYLSNRGRRRLLDGIHCAKAALFYPIMHELLLPLARVEGRFARIDVAFYFIGKRADRLIGGSALYSLEY